MMTRSRPVATSAAVLAVIAIGCTSQLETHRHAGPPSAEPALDQGPIARAADMARDVKEPNAVDLVEMSPEMGPLDAGPGARDLGAPDAADVGSEMPQVVEGPTSSFCACAQNNPQANAGAFEGCATLLADGRGTYYDGGPYPRSVDAETIAGLPQGRVDEGSLDDSVLFPGTTRRYWVYVPAQYDAAQPAALLVLFDGEVYSRNGNNAPYRTPTVLDNLIAEGAMPPTIAVFVDPGVRGDGSRNRSFEYDTPDDRNVRFVLEELLPAALGDLQVSDDPSLRAIGGRSSGGAAAFTAAWHRPDAFGLVYTTLGSFVRLKANADGDYADIYPQRIADMARKPLRVTLLSGSMDLDNQFGNWRDAHMAMTAALDCAGYAYRSGFGTGRHADGSHPRHTFGEDLRWLFGP